MNSSQTVQLNAMQTNFSVPQQAYFAKFGAVVKELFLVKKFFSNHDKLWVHQLDKRATEWFPHSRVVACNFSVRGSNAIFKS